MAAMALAATAVAAGEPRGEGATGREGRLTRSEVARGRAVEVLAYQSVGVLDSVAAATVVHCTNLGAEARTVYVDIYGFDGFLECTIGVSIEFGATATFATRATVLYEEDALCNPEPGTNQGSLDIWVTTSNAVICTVQVIDPSVATPKYATTLDLFRR